MGRPLTPPPPPRRTAASAPDDLPTERPPPAAARPGPVRVIAGAALSGFLAWQSVRLFEALREDRPGSWALLALLAWVFNMFVTGTFAFVGFVLPTFRLLPDGYYRVRSPDRLRRVCRVLRVDLFRRVLLATLWRNRARRRRFFDGTRAGVERLDHASRSAEFGHAGAFLVVSAAAVVWTADGAAALAGLTFAWNVAGNFYPVLLQRSHRVRVQRLRSRRA